MVSEFVDRTGGSQWESALPTGGSKWMKAQPARVGSADMRFPGDPGKPENSGT